MEKTQEKNKEETILDIKKSDAVHAKKKVFFVKQWWNNYLGRLNKVTKGKPQCCK